MPTGLDSLILANPDTTASNNDVTGGMWNAVIKATWETTTLTNANNNLTLLDEHNFLILNASSSAFALTIPTAVGRKGKVYGFRKDLADATTNAITLNASLSETIGGSSSLTITNNKFAVFIRSNGVIWEVDFFPTVLILNNQDNNLGAHYLDIKEIATPASPSADHVRVFVDSADEHVKAKKSGGAVVDLESGGAGAGNSYRSLSTTQTLQNTDNKLKVTASCTLTLPDASDFGAGNELWIKHGTASAFVITIQRNGTDTIEEGTSSITMNTINEVTILVSDGVSNWMVFL